MIAEKIPRKYVRALNDAEKDWLNNEGRSAISDYEKYSQDLIYPKLVAVISESFAYQFKISEIARQWFLEVNCEVKQLSSLAKNEDYKESVDFDMKKNMLVEDSKNHSKQNRRCRKAMNNLILAHKSLEASYKDEIGAVDAADDELRSSASQIATEYLPTLLPYRIAKAQAIVGKYHLKKELKALGYQVADIQQLASDSLQNLLKKGDRLEPSLVGLFRFIEYVGINRALAGFLLDLGYKPVSLITLRKQISRNKPNTVCELCYKSIHKRSVKKNIEDIETCTKRENSLCLRHKNHMKRRELDEIENVLEGNKCSNEKCKNSPSVKHYYSGKFYCSKACYDAQRKRKYRNKPR